MMLRLAALGLLVGGSAALPQLRRLQQNAQQAFRLQTNGASVDGSIDHPAGSNWFVFHGQGGASYEFETATGTLDDTVMDLLDTDASTLLDENDDDSRDPNSYASFLEWTCPGDGDYYIMVKGYGRSTGTYTLSVTQVGGGMGGVGGGDPCNGGQIIDHPEGEISFMPDGNYGDNAYCVWSIQCADASRPPMLSFTQFDTEADYDFVTLHDGMGVTDSTIGPAGGMSGSLADLPNRVFNGASRRQQCAARCCRAVSVALTHRLFVLSPQQRNDHRVCHGRQRHGRRLRSDVPLRSSASPAAAATAAAAAAAAPAATTERRPCAAQQP